MSDTEILASERNVAGAISPPVGQGHGVQQDHDHGLSDRGYVAIFFVLAVITGIEVAWSYLPWRSWSDSAALHIFEVGGLLFLMVIKFLLVASRFMHLKFDDKLLSRLFYAGLLLAVTVYLVALSTFHLFKGTHYVNG
jgi:cytochrome c oxidase subunit 4